MAELLVLTPLYPEMEEATIGRWAVAPGDAVTAGQVVVELITDKVAYELSSTESGTVLAVLAAEKSVVPVGTVLAAVGEGGEALPALAVWAERNRQLSASREAALTALNEATAADGLAPTAAVARTVRATPAARRLARERGVDLGAVTGTGPDGMVTADDVEHAAKG